MRALIQNELRQSRKQLLIWLGVMLLVIGFCYYEFLSLKDSLSDVAQMLAGFPELLNIMFGVAVWTPPSAGIVAFTSGQPSSPLPMHSTWGCPVWRRS